jgi:hypothetical protein
MDATPDVIALGKKIMSIMEKHGLVPLGDGTMIPVEWLKLTGDDLERAVIATAVKPPERLTIKIIKADDG